uniref:Ribosomal protein S7 n=1 Tax=Boodleopsis sp. H.0758 TaxID=2320802 RepID=A0A386AZQ9_9CHLO|nr:ribosomal protein S7 [Boodleopsis sp. H.0758]AYC64934.1 ribosomal protein S7 [Boodleopsis sp. H.0758]
MPRIKKLNINKFSVKQANKTDYLYSSKIVYSITQRIIKHGKKNLAYRIVQKSLKNIEKQTKQDPLITIEKAIRNTTPSLEIRTRRTGGSVYSVAVELGFNRGTSKAIKWILSAAKKRSAKTFDLNLANEFIDASKKSGSAFNKKEEIHKIADTKTRLKTKRVKKTKTK